MDFIFYFNSYLATVPAYKKRYYNQNRIEYRKQGKVKKIRLTEKNKSS